MNDENGTLTNVILRTVFAGYSPLYSLAMPSHVMIMINSTQVRVNYLILFIYLLSSHDNIINM